jgi:hypothetical protein
MQTTDGVQAARYDTDVLAHTVSTGLPRANISILAGGRVKPRKTPSWPACVRDVFWCVAGTSRVPITRQTRPNGKWNVTPWRTSLQRWYHTAPPRSAASWTGSTLWWCPSSARDHDCRVLGYWRSLRVPCK